MISILEQSPERWERDQKSDKKREKEKEKKVKERESRKCKQDGG